MAIIDRNIVLRSAIAALVVAVTMDGAAEAATLTNTAPWTNFDPEVGFDIFVPQFNPVLGALTGVSASLTGQFTPVVGFGEAPPSPVEFNPKVFLSGVSQGFETYVIDITQFLPTEFAPIGSDLTAVGTPEAVNISTTLPLAAVSFVGPGLLDFFGGGMSGVEPSVYTRYGGFDEPQVSGQLAITYTYTPVVEPESLALLGAGLLGLCGIGLRARRST